MEIIKCDICKKAKKDKYSSLDEKSKWVTLTVNTREDWRKYDLCGRCSENLLKYLRKYLEIKKSKKK